MATFKTRISNAFSALFGGGQDEDPARIAPQLALNQEQPVKPENPEQLEEEIAAPSNIGIRQVWRDSVANNLSPGRLASILQSAVDGDARDYLTLAEEMEERDLHYSSVLGTRKLALAGLQIRVDAYSDDEADVKRADEIRAIGSSPAFSEAKFDLCDALGKAYSVVEMMWDRSAKPWKPAAMIWRDPRFFTYNRDTGTELRLLDDADPANGIPLPPYKFIVHKPKLRSGLPIRGGIARLVAVAYMCKAYSWKDWMAFADVFGMPLRLGTYSRNAKEADIRKLMSAVANLGTDAAGVIPDSTKITFEQAPNTGGSADFFEKLATWWDKQISKAVLGQTMTADDGASLSQAQVHNDVRLDLLAADAEALEITLNRDLVRPYVDLNYGDGRYPKLVVVVPEPEDTKALIDAVKTLVPMGLEVEMSVMRDKLGLPEPAPGAVLLTAPVQAQPVAPDPAMNRALNVEQPKQAASDREDQLATLLTNAADPLVGDWVEKITHLIDNAGSLEEIRDGLLDLLPDMDANKFADVMQHALAVANVAGMFDSLEDSR